MFDKLVGFFRGVLQQKAKFRIALGLSSILISLLLVAVFIGLLPDSDVAVMKRRTAIAELVATHTRYW